MPWSISWGKCHKVFVLLPYTCIMSWQDSKTSKTDVHFRAKQNTIYCKTKKQMKYMHFHYYHDWNTSTKWFSICVFYTEKLFGLKGLDRSLAKMHSLFGRNSFPVPLLLQSTNINILCSLCDVPCDTKTCFSLKRKTLIFDLYFIVWVVNLSICYLWYCMWDHHTKKYKTSLCHSIIFLFHWFLYKPEATHFTQLKSWRQPKHQCILP